MQYALSNEIGKAHRASDDTGRKKDQTKPPMNIIGDNRGKRKMSESIGGGKAILKKNCLKGTFG